MNPTQPGARYDAAEPSIVIDHVVVDDHAVVAEARRWAAGRRGTPAPVDDLDGVDLSAFVTQAIVVGTHAIGIAGDTQETFNLEGMVVEVGQRAAEASARAAESTGQALEKAAAGMAAASVTARQVIADAGVGARRAFAENVDAARAALSMEIHRLVGGDQPELLTRLAPLLDKFGSELDARSAKQTSELIEKVVRQFDAADPASPMSQHARSLADQHRRLTEVVAANHMALGRKVDELAAAVTIVRAADSATAAAIRHTPLKGEGYAQSMHRLMGAVAAGLGDEYVDVSSVTGMLSRSRKGDGVLAIQGDDARIVLEMSDSTRGSGWAPYLEEAERNRGAIAALGLVRSAEQLGGAGVVSLGSRRIVLAFDPDSDHPDLLRTVVQLLRIAAQAASARDASAEVHTVQEKLDEALILLTQIDGITKLAGLIRQNASKINTEADGVRGKLTRLLSQARAALAGASGEGSGHEAA